MGLDLVGDRAGFCGWGLDLVSEAAEFGFEFEEAVRRGNMKRHYWTAICTEERLKAMADLTRIIDQYATILNFQRFSDVSLSLVLELEANKVSELQIALRQVLLLEGEDVAPTNTTKDCLVLMNVTFARGKGNLEVEMPLG